jgi:hypothetical protein
VRGRFEPAHTRHPDVLQNDREVDRRQRLEHGKRDCARRPLRADRVPVKEVDLVEEVTGRDAATRRLRRRSANFPTGKTLASWRAEDSTVPEPTPNSLVTLEWIGRAENVVREGELTAVEGPVCTGPQPP